MVQDLLRTLTVLRKCFRYMPDGVHHGDHEEEISKDGAVCGLVRTRRPGCSGLPSEAASVWL